MNKGNNTENSSTLIEPKPPILKSNFEAYIALDRDEANPGEIEEIAIRNGFREQTSLHITIMSTGEEPINNWLKEDPTHSVQTIEKLLKGHRWKFKLGKIYHIKSDFEEIDGLIENRESYVRTIELPDIKKYFKEVNSLVGADLPVQFPHITLFTKGERPNPTYYGIPIPSLDDFENMSPEKKL